MSTKLFSIVAALALLGIAPLNAQEYPNKVITVIVPFTAGGPTDAVAVCLSVPMSKILGTQMIVENVGGAGGTIGANRVAKAAADAVCTFPASYRHVHRAGALSQAALRRGQRFRTHRFDQ